MERTADQQTNTDAARRAQYERLALLDVLTPTQPSDARDFCAWSKSTHELTPTERAARRLHRRLMDECHRFELSAGY